MATSAAPVVLIRLQSADVFDEDIKINMDKLAEIYNTEVVTEEERFVNLLKHQMPKVAVLADNAVALPENGDLRGLLYGYIKAGGMVILAFQFAAMCNDNDLDSTFKDLGLPMWTHASTSMSALTRTNLGRNPTMRAVFGEAAFDTMKESYEIEAVHIEGVEDREKFYVPLRFDLNVTKINGRDSACTSAFTRVGAGYLGYVGDFPLQFGTVRVMKVMIGELSLSADPFLRCLSANIWTDKALGTPTSVHAPSAYTPGMSPSLRETCGP